MTIKCPEVVREPESLLAPLSSKLSAEFEGSLYVVDSPHEVLWESEVFRIGVEQVADVSPEIEQTRDPRPYAIQVEEDRIITQAGRTRKRDLPVNVVETIMTRIQVTGGDDPRFR